MKLTREQLAEIREDLENIDIGYEYQLVQKRDKLIMKTVPALLAHIEALEAENARLREAERVDICHAFLASRGARLGGG